MSARDVSPNPESSLFDIQSNASQPIRSSVHLLILIYKSFPYPYIMYISVYSNAYTSIYEKKCIPIVTEISYLLFLFNFGKKEK